MFRKTDTNPQLDLFTAPGNILPKRTQKKYTDEKAGHYWFFKLITSQINEDAFKLLFEETKMGGNNVSIRMLVATSILKEDWFRHRLLISYCCMWMNLRRLALFLTTTNQIPLPESVSSLMDKTRISIYRLMEAIVGSIKVIRKYLTFLAEISVLSTSKLRFYVSEQKFTEISLLRVDSVILLLKFRPWKMIPESHPAVCLVQLFKR
ncbi:MAG: hypothetical protein PT953_08605 [Prevotella sp.]|nr:hypothetical protein [Prevotella sp.]